MACTVSTSYVARCGRRRTRVRSVWAKAVGAFMPLPIAGNWHHEKVHFPLSYRANMGYRLVMPRRGAMLGTLSLDRGGGPPHRQLYRALREAILPRRLPPRPPPPA